jgi:DNA invertase Pin-like site-specific DNA recombinase
MPIAYSYIRFSHPSQAEGDSLRRQTERATEYCRRHELKLDTSLTLADLGVSAFRGKNAAVGNFRKFLDAVKTGRVSPGSVLIVESFDRISRQGIDEAYDLVKSILKSGVRIVTLSPEREFDRDATRSLSKGALEIQLILERAAEESERKSERVGAAWASKKRKAASEIVTRKVPGWITVEDGRLTLIAERATIIRDLFQLALEGHGVHSIAKRLNEDGIPVLGRTKFKGRPVVWNETVVFHLLKTRSVIGEYQPGQGRGSDRKPVGDPIKGYFPPVVTEETFYRVQGLLRARAKVGRGRRGKHVNLFAGLLRDSRDGGTMTYKHLGNRASAIIPVGAKQGHTSTWTSFGAEVFEKAIVSKLCEIKPRDVFPETTGNDQRAEAVAAKLSEVEELIAKWQAKMDVLDKVDAVAQKMVELDGRRKSLVEELATIRQEESSPLAESWGQFRSLGEMLAKDNSPELRERVRTALRRAIDEVTVLITRGRPRFCVAQVRFKGEPSRVRDYVILHVAGTSNGKAVKPGRHEVLSLSRFTKRGDVDLRNRKDSMQIEKALASVSDKELTAA